MWLASVAPLVNTTSCALQPSTRAVLARAALKARLALCPGPCCEDGLAQSCSNTGSIAATTAGAGGVVAL
ncbi:hypothetical protein D9M69_668040 [compost metagenome]